MRHSTRLSIGLALAGLLTVSACSSSTTKSGATNTGPGTTKKSCKVGFANPTGQNTYTKAVVDAIQIEVEKQGCTFTSLDSQLNLSQQISDVQTFITQKVNAIVIYPLDYSAEKNILTKAANAGIGVFGDDADVTAVGPDAPPPPLTGQLIDGHLDRAFIEQRFKYLASVLPNGGQVAYIGFGGTVAPLDKDWALTQEVAKDYPQFDLVGRINNPTDDIAGAQAPAAAELTKYPDLKAFIAYNDPSAIGAAAAIKNAGKQGQVYTLGAQLQPEGVAALRTGQLSVTWDFQPVTEGVKLSTLILAYVNGDTTAAKKVVTGGYKEYTKSTVSSFISTADQLAALKK